jgi:hypothetical protein
MFGSLVLLTMSLTLRAAGQERSGQVLVDPAQAAGEGKTLVTDLLSRQVDRSLTNTGKLLIRKPDGTEVERGVMVSTFAIGTNSVFLYSSTDGAVSANSMALKIVSTPGKPNEYSLSRGGGEAQPLAADQLSTEFAGSDYWACDLGLEFLQWPNQRLVRKEMRRGQWCNVLESETSASAAGGYSRVVSWIDADTGGIVHADAYDAHKRLLKQFDPKEFRKVKGTWELEQMEIRNRQTGSRTILEFHLAQ